MTQLTPVAIVNIELHSMRHRRVWFAERLDLLTEEKAIPSRPERNQLVAHIDFIAHLNTLVMSVYSLNLRPVKPGAWQPRPGVSVAAAISTAQRLSDLPSSSTLLQNGHKDLQ